MYKINQTFAKRKCLMKSLAGFPGPLETCFKNIFIINHIPNPVPFLFSLNGSENSFTRNCKIGKLSFSFSLVITRMTACILSS